MTRSKKGRSRTLFRIAILFWGILPASVLAQDAAESRRLDSLATEVERALVDGASSPEMQTLRERLAELNQNQARLVREISENRRGDLVRFRMEMARLQEDRRFLLNAIRVEREILLRRSRAEGGPRSPLLEEILRRQEALRNGSAGNASRPAPLLLGQRIVAGAELAPLNSDLARYFHAMDGLLVVSVAPGSPAARAGLRAGDVIAAVDGRSAASLDEFRRILSSLTPSRRPGVSGDGVPIRISREGQLMELRLGP